MGTIQLFGVGNIQSASFRLQSLKCMACIDLPAAAVVGGGVQSISAARQPAPTPLRRSRSLDLISYALHTGSFFLCSLCCCSWVFSLCTSIDSSRRSSSSGEPRFRLDPRRPQCGHLGRRRVVTLQTDSGRRAAHSDLDAGDAAAAAAGASTVSCMGSGCGILGAAVAEARGAAGAGEEEEEEEEESEEEDVWRIHELFSSLSLSSQQQQQRASSRCSVIAAPIKHPFHSLTDIWQCVWAADSPYLGK
ncbi:hypothetical protein CAPTEDRAFT_186280 [Capitella teleta]|uniref:Uncharacterized protein n=1 Tax=Capitella teleta TaxID=283909 RepID=R7V8U8_CAPTE|nr:hypothetical protein CAPTEDRAFT_186280 [Capitella teleta]|eukprot:ELU14994.1 hypothetical protein CAPTEDRAFT_186280 [Capitella teleta]